MLAAAAGRLARRRSAAAQLAELAAAHYPASNAGAAQQAAATAAAARLQLRRWVATGAGSEQQVAPAVLAKARRIAGPVGLLAGVFGSIVGVGGGVIIVPTIVSSCKTIPQRWVMPVAFWTAACLLPALIQASRPAPSHMQCLSAPHSHMRRCCACHTASTHPVAQIPRSATLQTGVWHVPSSSCEHCAGLSLHLHHPRLRRPGCCRAHQPCRHADRPAGRATDEPPQLHGPAPHSGILPSGRCPAGAPEGKCAVWGLKGAACRLSFFIHPACKSLRVCRCEAGNTGCNVHAHCG